MIYKFTENTTSLIDCNVKIIQFIFKKSNNSMLINMKKSNIKYEKKQKINIIKYGYKLFLCILFNTINYLLIINIVSYVEINVKIKVKN